MANSLQGDGKAIFTFFVGATVIIGSLFIPGDIRFFIPVTTSLAFLTSDFVFIAAYLISQNAILGTFIMAPIILIYVLTVIEWLRGKD